MAITEIKPKDQDVLKQKVRDSKPGEEKQLVRDVSSQVSNRLLRNNERFATNYNQFDRDTAVGRFLICKDEIKDIQLSSSCVVYIIIGKCIVRGQELSELNLGKATVGHLVTDETFIQLQRKTIVIIFDY